jgi:hypothetical protein
MPSLTLPPDLAETADSLRWYADDRLARQFHRLVQQGIAWSPQRPRQLIRVAHRHAVAVDGVRLIAVALTGFHGPQRGRAMAEAVTRLRLAIADVAEGREPVLAYADRDLLVFDSGAPGPRFDAWSTQDPFNAPPPALSSADMATAQNAITASNAAAAAASTPAAANGPQFPRGTMFTRGH